MKIDLQYEEITPDEADFIISLYEAISELVRAGRPVTILGLSTILLVDTSELSDYLPQIVSILNKVEEEYQIR